MIELRDWSGAVPPGWEGVLAEGPGIQSRPAALEAMAAAACPSGSRPMLALWRLDGAPAGCLPLFCSGRGASGLTSPYTVLFQPLVAPGRAEAFAGALGPALRSWPVVTLDALDGGWPGLDPFLAGMRRAGRVPLRFDAFGNWHEELGGRDWDAYLADRPGALREVVRRRGKAAEKEGVRFRIIAGPDGLEEGLAAYEAVYRRSWKAAEPFPDFTAALLRRLAPRGEMRLALMWRNGSPVAAQYWTLENGIATVLKLAHDEAAKAFSPGTLLTAAAIRHLIAAGATELDFGRGDDPYKKQWAGQRRQRIGVVLADPRRPAGLAVVARHVAGRVLRRLRA